MGGRRWPARGQPLGTLEAGDVKVDQRPVRRELTTDEIVRLLKATESGGKCSKLTGLDRAMLYRVAISTGLRARELGSFTPKSFNLAADPATVEIIPSDENARRGVTLPLPSDLVTALRPWLTRRPANTPLWPGRWSEQKRGAGMMRYDLSAARTAWLKEADGQPNEIEAREKSDFLEYMSHDGEQADFHSLRHTFLSRLSRSSASPKVMKLLARYTTVELTIGRYAHASLHDLASAVAGLPPLPSFDPQPVGATAAILRATGTTDASHVVQESEAFEASFAPDGKLILFPQVTQSHFADDAEPVSIPITKQPEIRGKTRVSRLSTKRRGGDSNPREACTPTSFRD